MNVLALAGASANQDLAPQATRISDQVIASDQSVYTGAQARIQRINDSGRPVADYHLSLSQCWLDASFHEYTRNDRGGFPSAALAESYRLDALMEAAGPGARLEDWTVPLVNGAPKVRPDLWRRAEALRSHEGWSCVAQRVACAQVELVHGGNELKQIGWRHSKPYIQIAEDKLSSAERDAATCIPKPAPVLAAVQAPAPMQPAPAPVVRETLDMAAAVVFAFDKDRQADIAPYGQQQLDQLITKMRQPGVRPMSVKLFGHADRLNATGNAAYNMNLSMRRAETLRNWFVAQGVDRNLIEVEARGDTSQVSSCSTLKSRKVSGEDAERGCLLPNRRVEIIVKVEILGAK